MLIKISYLERIIKMVVSDENDCTILQDMINSKGD